MMDGYKAYCRARRREQYAAKQAKCCAKRREQYAAKKAKRAVQHNISHSHSHPASSISQACPATEDLLSQSCFSRDTNTAPLPGNPTSRMLAQQPTRDSQFSSAHNPLGSTMNEGTSATFDEFQYGFPSTGLSTISFRWWGDKDDGSNGTRQRADEEARETKQQVKESEAETTDGKEDEIEADTQWTGLLTSVRKKAAEEGRRALKLGIYGGLDSKTLHRTRKMMLLKIFRSSLPEEWGDLSIDPS